MEIDELSRNLENKKESQKATAEKLKEAKRSCEALKKELKGLGAKGYGTKLEVMLIREKAAATEHVAASRQSFKDTSKAKEYQHRKDATSDKMNGLILARRAGVGSTGFQVQLLESNQHAPVLNPSVLSAYPCSHATQPYLWRKHHGGGSPPPSELSYHSNDNRYAGGGGGPPGEVSYNNDNRYSGRGSAYNDGSACEDKQTYGHNDGAPCCGHGGDGLACDERAYRHNDGASHRGHGGAYNDGLACDKRAYGHNDGASCRSHGGTYNNRSA
jgi:hypothetical protein